MNLSSSKNSVNSSSEYNKIWLFVDKDEYHIRSSPLLLSKPSRISMLLPFWGDNLLWAGCFGLSYNKLKPLLPEFRVEARGTYILRSVFADEDETLL